MKFNSVKSLLAFFPLSLSLLVSGPANAETMVFGQRYASGPKGVFPRLAGEIVNTCVDGWIDSVRCGEEARWLVANKFCQQHGYERSSNYWLRRSFSKNFTVATYQANGYWAHRNAYGAPTMFTEITCKDKLTAYR